VIRAVVFDFDGVLANSEPLHFRAFRDILAEEGLSLTERDYYTRYLGYDDVGAFRAIAADQNRQVTDGEIANWVVRKAERLEALERGVSVLFPGARDAIARMARSGPIAIASGALREEIMRVLEREQLAALFAAVVAAGDTPASKPDPAPYSKAVELLRQMTGDSLQAGDCVAIEDSHWGLVSAKHAGLRTLAITHSYPANELGEADLVIEHLDELTPELLLRFTKSG
jgi:HAD superfamily hydrolase (TIGR01509 family)